MLEIKKIYLPRREPRSLGESLAKFLRSNPEMLRKYTLAVVSELWMTANPADIIRETGSISLRDHVLYITIYNPALRASLTVIRANILSRLNEELVIARLSDVKFV